VYNLLTIIGKKNGQKGLSALGKSTKSKKISEYVLNSAKEATNN